MSPYIPLKSHFFRGALGRQGQWFRGKGSERERAKTPMGFAGISSLMPVRVYVSPEFRKIGEINVKAEGQCINCSSRCTLWHWFCCHFSLGLLFFSLFLFNLLLFPSFMTHVKLIQSEAGEGPSAAIWNTLLSADAWRLRHVHV